MLRVNGLLITLLLASVCSGQKYTISGYVSDAKTQEKIIGAVVYDKKTRQGATTNSYGFYSLTLRSDSVKLVISYVGYAGKQKDLFLNSNMVLEFNLNPDIELKEVEVIAEAESIEERSQMSVINIPVEQIKKVPALLGETDVLKVLQLLPGVKSGGEGTSGLYVRGGGPDQNLILLDGAPIYNASHLFGFFSTFNADAVKNVELTKGGFPARYGGRLSSVIDISMKEGNMRRFNVEGQFGIIASKLMIEGPIWKNRTSFIVTARRTYIDRLMAPFFRAATLGEGKAGYYFYDLNLKVNHILSPRDRIFLSGYLGLDKFYFESGGAFTGDISYEGYLRWGNKLGAARWNHVFSNKLFCNTSVTYTQYKFGVGQSVHDLSNDSSIILDYFSGINDWAAKVNFEYIPDPSHYIRFGTNYTYHTFKTGAAEFKVIGSENQTNAKIGNPDIFANEVNAYVEDDWKVNSRIKLNAGVHAALFDVKGELFHSVQPRFSGRYMLPRNWSVKASYATMMQFIHLLANSNVGLPTDLWVPATNIIKPQRSYQGALGLAKSLKNNMFELSIEGYYKYMRDIIDYLDGANFIGGSADWEKKVAQGNGWSYGAEFLLQKKKGKYTGWIGYTLSWTNRQFKEINFGNVYPYKYDRRHDISFVNIYKLSNKTDIAATWVYGTGNAISLPLQSYSAAAMPGIWANDAQYYVSKNNYRMAPYHRLDISINKHKKKKWGKVTWSFGAYNLYARQNPYFLYFRTNQYGRKQLMQVSLFRFIPAISWRFKFDFRNYKDIFKDDEEIEEFDNLD